MVQILITAGTLAAVSRIDAYFAYGLRLDPDIGAMDQHMTNKNDLRKHGANAYCGQN